MFSASVKLTWTELFHPCMLWQQHADQPYGCIFLAQGLVKMGRVRHCLPSVVLLHEEIWSHLAYSGSACTPLLVVWTEVYLCTEPVMAYVVPCFREWACNLLLCLWSFLICLNLESEFGFSHRNREPDDQP